MCYQDLNSEKGHLLFEQTLPRLLQITFTCDVPKLDAGGTLTVWGRPQPSLALNRRQVQGARESQAPGGSYAVEVSITVSTASWCWWLRLAAWKPQPTSPSHQGHDITVDHGEDDGWFLLSTY